MNVSFTQKELAAIKILSEVQELTEEQVIKQALRLYQDHIIKIRNGETVHWSGDKERAAKFVGCDVVE